MLGTSFPQSSDPLGVNGEGLGHFRDWKQVSHDWSIYTVEPNLAGIPGVIVYARVVGNLVITLQKTLRL